VKNECVVVCTRPQTNTGTRVARLIFFRPNFRYPPLFEVGSPKKF